MRLEYDFQTRSGHLYFTENEIEPPRVAMIELMLRIDPMAVTITVMSEVGEDDPENEGKREEDQIVARQSDYLVRSDVEYGDSRWRYAHKGGPRLVESDPRHTNPTKMVG